VCLVLICVPHLSAGTAMRCVRRNPSNAFTVYFVVRGAVWCSGLELLLFYAGRDVTGYVYASAYHCAAFLVGLIGGLDTLSVLYPLCPT
jgi:uncharacterized membrane protein